MGIPSIAQVAWFKFKPAGKFGVELQDTNGSLLLTPPRVRVGTMGLAMVETSTPSSMTYGEDGYIIFTGF